MLTKTAIFRHNGERVVKRYTMRGTKTRQGYFPNKEDEKRVSGEVKALMVKDDWEYLGGKTNEYKGEK